MVFVFKFIVFRNNQRTNMDINDLVNDLEDLQDIEDIQDNLPAPREPR